jgi:hypothetical protein
MAGTINLSLSQQFDEHGSPLSGGRLYTIQAGTTATPQSAYQDADLTLALPNPIILDAAGRVPPFFLADGQIKIRLTDANGVDQIVADNLLVIGPSSGGGGGGSVDPTTIFQTGDVMWLDVDATRSGWVRENGRTIGSASSGATERANADTEALFNWLWQNFDNAICAVNGGRGASSAADWSANKTIATPNKRGHIVGGLDTMGNSAASSFTGVPVVSGSTSTAGSVVGETLNTLTTAQMPSHTHSGTTGSESVTHTHTYDRASSAVNAAGGLDVSASSSVSSSTTGSASQPHTHAFTTGSSGSGTAHNNVQKTVLGTFYRKL